MFKRIEMKKLTSNFFAILTFSGIFLFSSCANDDAIEPDDPADDVTKYLGTLSVQEDSKDNGKNTYTVAITDSTPYLQIAYLY